MPGRPAENECPPLPFFTFTQGFILGQFTIILVLYLLAHYLLFAKPPPAGSHREQYSSRFSVWRTANQRVLQALFARRATPPAEPPNTPAVAILDALNYTTLAPESLAWFNILVANVVAVYRRIVLVDSMSPEVSEEALETPDKNVRACLVVETFLNPGHIKEKEPTSPAASGSVVDYSDDEEPDSEEQRPLVELDYMQVADVSLGDRYPVFTRASVPSNKVGINLDFEYLDDVWVSVTTALIINVPRPRFAMLPISVEVHLRRIAGTLLATVVNTEAPRSPPTVMMAGPAARPPKRRLKRLAKNVTWPALVPIILVKRIVFGLVHLVLSVLGFLVGLLPLPRRQRPPKKVAEKDEPSDEDERVDIDPGAARRPALRLSLLPDFEMDIAVSSLLGSRTKLQNEAKVQQLIADRIRALVEAKLVHDALHVPMPVLSDPAMP